MALLEEEAFLSDWKNVDDLKLSQRLLAFCSEIYEPVWETSLNELFLEYEEINTDDAANFLSRGILPLLRLDFDHLGVGYSTLANFFVSAESKKSALFRRLGQEEKEWQRLISDNQFLVLYVQVRQMIPFDAMRHLRERGESAERRLSSLNDEEEEELS